MKEIVVTAAREELLPRFTRVGFSVKSDNSVVTEADYAMQARLQSALAPLAPEVQFLGEEMSAETQGRLLATGAPTWCLDPLDGTSNFVAGLPFFCVSLALLREGRPVLGIIYDPVRDECFHAQEGGGAFLNGEPLRPGAAHVALSRSIAIVDFKRLAPALRRRLVEHPPVASFRNFGSSALEWAWIAAGRGHVYLHGGQKLWDYAAGSLILSEAGGQSSTLSGEPVYVPTMAARSVIASRYGELYDPWRQWIGASL